MAKKRKWRSPTLCSASCCPKPPLHGTGSRMAVQVDCMDRGAYDVCNEQVKHDPTIRDRLLEMAKTALRERRALRGG